MKKLNYVIVAMLLLCLATSANSFGQKTGSYDTSITFMGAPRKISIYVPPAYDPAIPYRLVVGLHGLGDNCANYRNGLISSLGWASVLPNTIFVCPEASTVNSDFYAPAGSEAIIQECVTLAEEVYHIDTANIILQGFSLGGRAALRYGLDNHSSFKGLLLNTPAIQGVKQALNGHSTYPFHYANAPLIPIYITCGLDDALYVSPIDSVFKQLVMNDGLVKYRPFTGMAHAIPAIGSIIDFIPFFDTPSADGYDLAIVKITVPQRYFSTSVPATCMVQNTGNKTIHSITFNIVVDGTPTSDTWTGTLIPFQHTEITLPTISAATGSHTITVNVASLDGGVTDTITINNTKSDAFQVVTSGMALPLTEGFEGATFPPADWIQYLAGDAYSAWSPDNTVHKTGSGSAGAFNTILIFDNAGRKEELATPLLDLTSAQQPYLSFDVAYNYHRYTPPYLTVDTSFADTLEVFVSTDLGATYTSIYRKRGADLATFTSPILNATSIAAAFIAPTAGNWRTDIIDLAGYAASDKAIFKFSYTSALGGSINIDNIKVAGTPLHTPQMAGTAYKVYPNPSENRVNIFTGNDHLDRITLADATGKEVLQVINTEGNNELSVNTSELANGVYLVRVFTENKVQNTMLTVQH